MLRKSGKTMTEIENGPNWLGTARKKERKK